MSRFTTERQTKTDDTDSNEAMSAREEALVRRSYAAAADIPEQSERILSLADSARTSEDMRRAGFEIGTVVLGHALYDIADAAE